jgi:nuclear cap-binding protein subunit 1
MLLNIASSTKLPEDEAIEIAEFLRDNYDDEEARNEFFDVLVQLFVSLDVSPRVPANMLQRR